MTRLSKKELARRAKLAFYEVDIEVPSADSEALLDRLTALFRRKDTLYMQGDGSICRTSLIPCFNLVELTHRTPPRPGFVTIRVRFGNGVRHVLGEQLSPLELVAAAERFALDHIGPTKHHIPST